ncbi:MAG: hypothetical protein NT001_07055, partial [Candidatus Woesearchaeota archaeon]|nr:hypothetical protein [Candidatus Woesearchaeota archaeon]
TPEICKYRDNLCKEYIRLRKEGIPEEESFNRVIPQFREFFDLTNPNCIDPERENKLKENNLYQLIYSALQTESKRQTGCPEIVYVD